MSKTEMHVIENTYEYQCNRNYLLRAGVLLMLQFWPVHEVVTGESAVLYCPVVRLVLCCL